MKNKAELNNTDVERTLEQASFQPDQKLVGGLRGRLQAARQGQERGWLKPAWRLQLSRSVLAGVLTALAALVLITGAVVALSPREKAANVVDGVGAVYQAGLVQPVNSQQMVGDITVTLDWVYADWNQVLVAYSAETTTGSASQSPAATPGPDANRVEIRMVSATLGDGTPLQVGPGSGYAQPGTEASVASLDMPAALRNQAALSVQVRLHAEHVRYLNLDSSSPASDVAQAKASPVQADRSGGGEVVFNLSIPVHAGRVIESGQVAASNGISIKLERLSLAPSMTIATLCFQAPELQGFHELAPIVSLETGSKQYPVWDSAPAQTAGDESCWQVNMRGSVPLDQPSYVLRVSELVGFRFGPGDSPSPDDHPEEQVRVGGPWVFEVK